MYRRCKEDEPITSTGQYGKDSLYKRKDGRLVIKKLSLWEPYNKLFKFIWEGFSRIETFFKYLKLFFFKIKCLVKFYKSLSKTQRII